MNRDKALAHTPKTDKRHVEIPPEQRFERRSHFFVTATFFILFITFLAGRSTFLGLRVSFVGLVVCAILLAAVALDVKIPRTAYIPAWPAVAFSLWCWWLALSALWSHPTARTTEALWEIATLGIGVIFVWILATYCTISQLRLIWVWLWGSGIVFLLGALTAGPGAQGRYSAFGGGPNVFVRIMILAAIAAFAIYLIRGSWIPLLTIPGFVVGAVLSGSRGGLLSFALVIAVAAIPIWRSTKGKGRMIPVAMMAGAASLLVATQASGPASEFFRRRFQEQTFDGLYTSGRDTIYDSAIALFLDKPIFGNGLDGYWANAGSVEGYEYTHNLPLASAVDGGVIALAALAISLVSFIAISAFSRSIDQLLFFYSGIFIIFTSMFSGDYFDSRFAWFLLGIAAVLSTHQSRAELRG